VALLDKRDAKLRYVVMNTNISRNILICAFLLPLIILVHHPALAQHNHKGLVAYIQGGDLWVKELPEGEAKQLTTSGDITNPRWSPSGQWLVYLKGDHLWVVQRSGTGMKPLEKGSPVRQFAWSPVSDTLAYSSRNGSLWVVSVSDWVEREIVVNPGGIRGTGVLGLAWSPDGEWIAYEWREGLTYQGLWKISADGGEPTELYVSGVPEKGEAVLAGWGGGGRFLLFWQGDILSASMLADGVPLYAIPAGGGTPVSLADAVLVHTDFVVAQPIDGEQVAVIAGGYRGAWTNKALRVVRPAGGTGEALTPPSQAASSPAWSPDGQRIAFSAMPDEGDLVGGETARQGLMQRRISVVSAQGDPQPRQLTNDLAYRDERPLWSAEGSHILFVRMDDREQISLWLMPVGEGEPRAVDSVPRLVAEGLGPLPGPPSGWFGYYGHIEWDGLFDWWTGTTSMVLPVTGNVLPGPLLWFIGSVLALVAGLGLMLWLRKFTLPSHTSE
jgi:dipeptidyl aminopeptidase/acylaminoacyl peptidase